VRIGLAAARALGLAWQAEVLGYPTLALVAAIACEGHPGLVTVCMTGGHGEWFVQNFGADGLPEQPLASLTPAEAGKYGHHEVVAGSQAQAMSAAAGPGHTALQILPDARRFPLLPPALLDSEPAPIYGRGPDARLPGAVA
jgi:tRNA A37 threonylcarbamoyladenosine modification protein TsaB